MPNPTHTPGAWSAMKHSEPNDDMRCAVVANRGKLAYLVATIENGAPGDFCDTEWANARLIAAAPELLSACSDWIAYLDADGEEGDGNDEERMLAAMRAAIRKAEASQ